MLDQFKPKVKPDVKPFSQDDLLLDAIKKDGMAKLEVTPFPYPAIVVGRAGRIQQEVKLNHVLLDGIPIFQRKGGGCSVFLDSGSLIVSVVFPAEGLFRIPMLFKKTNLWLIKGLKSSGLKTIYSDGISDIVINDRKVGGSCFYRAKGIAYYSASLLVSSDLNLMKRYLHLPSRSPKYRRDRSHLDFVTTLDSHFKEITIQDLSFDLKKNLDQWDL